MKRPNKAHQAINNKKFFPFPHCRSRSQSTLLIFFFH